MASILWGNQSKKYHKNNLLVQLTLPNDIESFEQETAKILLIAEGYRDI
jgi:hypothetical protein